MTNERKQLIQAATSFMRPSNHSRTIFALIRSDDYDDDSNTNHILFEFEKQKKHQKGGVGRVKEYHLLFEILSYFLINFPKNLLVVYS